MKSLILTLTLAAVAVSPIAARAADPKPDRPKREGGAGGRGDARMDPEERLKKMTESLALTPEQQGKIKTIMESGRAELSKLRDLPQDQRREKMREALKVQQDKINEVLTPEQKEKYKAEMEKRTREGGAPGDPSGRKPAEGGKKPDAAKPEGEK